MWKTIEAAAFGASEINDFWMTLVTDQLIDSNIYQ